MDHPLNATGTHAVGLDIGGTFVKVGVFDRQGALAARHEVPSEAHLGFDHLMRRAACAVDEAVARLGLTRDALIGIGVGYPGAVNPDTGRIGGSPNIPGAEGSNLVRPLENHFQRAVVPINDASAAAFGEAKHGVGREGDVRHLVLLTLGTGVGGGVVIDGKLLWGAHYTGSELGHMIVDPAGPLCGCGNFGCLEAFAGTAGIVACAWRKLQAGVDSLLWQHIRPFQAPELTPLMISQAAAAGDAVALSVWQDVGYWLGLGCVSVINALDPQVIAIGGQVAKAGAPLFDSIRRTVRARARLNPWPADQIVPAQLGEDAGIIGSGAFVLAELAAQA